MSKLRVQLRGRIPQISFSDLHAREVLKVQVEAESQRAWGEARVTTLQIMINLHQEEVLSMGNGPSCRFRPPKI